MLVEVNIGEGPVIEEEADDELDGGRCPGKPQGQKRQGKKGAPNPDRPDPPQQGLLGNSNPASMTATKVNKSRFPPKLSPPKLGTGGWDL